jgi:hypothetical protein
MMNSPLLVFALSLVVLGLSERAGASLRKRRRDLEQGEREDLNVIAGATLTLLGLIIGFSFSNGHQPVRSAQELRGGGGQCDRNDLVLFDSGH